MEVFIFILILAPSPHPSSSLPSLSCLRLHTFTQWLLLAVSLSVPGGTLLEALQQIQRLAPNQQDLLQNFSGGRRLQSLISDNEGGLKGLRWGKCPVIVKAPLLIKYPLSLTGQGRRNSAEGWKEQPCSGGVCGHLRHMVNMQT